MDDHERVQQFRRQQAPQKELDAIQAEVQADQWERIAKEFKSPEQMSNAATSRDRAEMAREAADKLHQMAGTKREDFYPQCVKAMRIQAEALRGDLVILKERAEHPDVYGGEPESLNFDVAANEALHKALLVKADELEALLEDETASA